MAERVLAENNDGFVAHIRHGDDFADSVEERNPFPESCDHCLVAREGWLADIHAAVFSSREALAVCWSMQDGYGAPGATPAQGFDWSGIRDSSPATVRRMWLAVHS